MKRFEIGDRVRYVNSKAIGHEVRGNVVGIGCLGAVAVRTDNPEDGVYVHSFGGFRGLFIDPEEWEKIYPTQKIIILSDGVKSVTAKLIEENKTVRTAVAMCNPKDNFDLSVGAKLAVDRLFKEKKRFFSVEKYIDFCNKFGTLVGSWAEECEGLEVIRTEENSRGTIKGTHYTSLKDWEVEKYE